MEDSGTPFDEELLVDIGDPTFVTILGTEPRARRVRASAQGLVVENVRTMAHDQIETAFSSSREERLRVVVADRKGHRLTIHVRSREEGERLLKALSFTTTAKNAAFKLLPPFHTPTVGSFILPLAFVSFISLARHDAGTFGFIAFGLFVIMIVLGLKIFNRKLTVGTDGVTISAFWGKRFIPYANMASINRYSDVVSIRGRRPRIRAPRRNEVVYSGVALHLRSNEDVRLPIVRGTHPSDELIGAAERIEEALDAWRGVRPIDDVTIDRRGRATHEWISSLRELGKSEATTYRVAAVDREALFAIVEDPANQASSRAAAAIAISAKLDDEARSRLRVSAAAIADPKLRVAIEYVVDEKEDALGDALDELAPIETNAQK